MSQNGTPNVDKLLNSRTRDLVSIFLALFGCNSTVKMVEYVAVDSIRGRQAAGHRAACHAADTAAGYLSRACLGYIKVRDAQYLL